VSRGSNGAADGEVATEPGRGERATAKPANADDPLANPVRDTYAILETGGNLFIHAFGGLFVQGEANVPTTGPVLMVSNHSSYLDPVAIGVASPRRVVFMAKAELFDNAVVGYFLRGVDSFPVRRGAADRAAFKTTMAMLQDGRVVCIFPEGTRSSDGNLMEAEPGAALFATRTGCPVVPVYVSGSNKMLTLGGKIKTGKILVTFGEPFTLPRSLDREEGGRRLMDAIARTRDEIQTPRFPVRQIGPHWFRKPLEGSRRS
jgi:1-acyl-sn-glycerol-3-phosphate acyltransferase